MYKFLLRLCHCRYLEWICSLHAVLRLWSDEAKVRQVSYSLLLEFLCNQETLNDIASRLEVEHHIMEKKKATDLRMSVIKILNDLDSLLLETLVSSRISVLSVLSKYGVSCDEQLNGAISRFVIFPDEEIDPQISVIHADVEQPLRLRSAVSISDVMMIYDKSVSVLKGIRNNLSMLIFFSDRQSAIFETFITVKLSADLQCSLIDPKVWSLTNQSQSPLSIGQFAAILTDANTFVENILSGKATYYELTSNGECDLLKINVQHEIQTFQDYCLRGQMRSDGVKGIKDTLELMQIASFFSVIEDVCEQCQLKNCTRDDQFKELKRICSDTENESKLKGVDLSEVSAKMSRVRRILKERNCQKLNEVFELFEAIHESSAFYQFIKDKGFYKDGGQTYFLANYELVTAELQHQNYPETVLNHLLGAFKLLSPFMNSDHTFGSLMESISELDERRGVKQLFRTVNEGITDIKLWFSNAAVSTLHLKKNSVNLLFI